MQMVSEEDSLFVNFVVADTEVHVPIFVVQSVASASFSCTPQGQASFCHWHLEGPQADQSERWQVSKHTAKEAHIMDCSGLLHCEWLKKCRQGTEYCFSIVLY